MTLISFSEVEFSFDKTLAVNKMADLKLVLNQLLKSGKVTDKTHGRLDNIFNVLGDGEFLQDFYQVEKYESLRGKLTEHLNYAVEHKRI